jgi:hypothetical protein
MRSVDDELALAAEAARKSAVLWLALPASPQPVAAWHVWVDGAVAVVHEGAEQHLPGLRDLGRVDVLLRSKDKGSLLLTVPAQVFPLEPWSQRYDEAVAALHAARQSAPDGEAQPARWAAESAVTLLEPVGPAAEAPGSYRPTSRRAAPVPTPATTLRGLPLVIGPRARRRPKL